MPEFEWDPNKEALNVRKHGFDFTTASLIWRGEVVERTDTRRDYGERRMIAIGEAYGSIIVVVYTRRGENCRIISARKAKSREKAFYQAEIGGRS